MKKIKLLSTEISEAKEGVSNLYYFLKVNNILNDLHNQNDVIIINISEVSPQLRTLLSNNSKYMKKMEIEA